MQLGRSQLPIRFLGLVPRSVLAEMLAQTYAEARGIDPNDAYRRLDTALANLRLIEGVQRGTWEALLAAKPNLDEKAVIEHVEKRLQKPRRFTAWKPKRAEQGASAAVTILIDTASSYSSGEATDLLGTPEGEKMLGQGFRLLGAHLAKQLLR